MSAEITKNVYVVFPYELGGKRIVAYFNGYRKCESEEIVKSK